jgi:glycosyltransferase involved in cell wall biosynthesis
MEIPNIRHAALMHVCSSWEQEDSARPLAHARQVKKIPNAVDLEALLPPLNKAAARQAVSVPSNATVFLFLARVAPDKSPDMLIQSWAKAEMPLDALLILAGPASPAYAQTLQELATSLGVSQNIRFPGYADNQAKRNWLSAADSFVLPSTDDSFSVAAIEAAAFGLSCILSPYVGAAEFIPPAQVTTANLDVDSWSNAMKSLSPLPSPSVRAEWTSELSVSSIGAQWRTLYTDVAVESKRGQLTKIDGSQSQAGDPR